MGITYPSSARYFDLRGNIKKNINLRNIDHILGRYSNINSVTRAACEQDIGRYNSVSLFVSKRNISL